jgi:hypothetical protein
MIPTPERRASDPWRAEMQSKIEKQEQELAEIRKELAESTAIIREMRDILVTVKSGARMFGWIGSAIKWISGVVAAGVALWAAFGPHAPK